MPYCFKYRIYPDQSQRETLDSAFEACRLLYNGCLEERITHYRKFQKGISYNEQSAQLPEIKEQGWFVGIHSQTIQEVLKRLDKAFQAFSNVSRMEKSLVFQGLRNTEGFDPSFFLNQILN